MYLRALRDQVQHFVAPVKPGFSCGKNLRCSLRAFSHLKVWAKVCVFVELNMFDPVRFDFKLQQLFMIHLCELRPPIFDIDYFAHKPIHDLVSPPFHAQKIFKGVWVFVSFSNQLFRKSSSPSKKCFDPRNKPNYSSVWSRLRPSLGWTKVWLFGPDPGQEGFTPVIFRSNWNPQKSEPNEASVSGP